MNYKLIALDLDGTLLNDDLVIYPRTIEMFQQLEDEGVLVTLATGRMSSSAIYYAKALNIKLPLIVYNGALIIDPIKNSIVYENNIPITAMNKIISYCQEKSLYLQFYDANQIIVEEITKETKIDPDTLHASCQAVGKFSNHPIKPSPKMMIVAEPNIIVNIQKELRILFNGHLDFVISKPYLLEILKSGSSKGRALELLSKYLGIDQESILAIGDSENDESMVKWAGLGVSVANATPLLKASADFSTTASYHLGVEEAIMHFVFDHDNRSALQEN